MEAGEGASTPSTSHLKYFNFYRTFHLILKNFSKFPVSLFKILHKLANVLPPQSNFARAANRHTVACEKRRIIRTLHYTLGVYNTCYDVIIHLDKASS